MASRAVPRNPSQPGYDVMTDMCPHLCRDCLCGWTSPLQPAGRCPNCGGRRVLVHAELRDLAIAHIDCDSFYATIEKRDRPELASRPLLIGGTAPRSVVATACYIARQYGCRSAMPMYKARELCPEAVVVLPDHAKYKRVSAEIHRIFRAYTDLIEPIALDEAYLDLAHRDDIPETLADIALRIEQEVAITVSVGFSHNKFLAKLASDLDKPRGFSVIGRADTMGFLTPLPVRAIHGVGPAMERRLTDDGFHTVGDLQTVSEMELKARYGQMGSLLALRARGEDTRRVTPDREAKSISSETTFDRDRVTAEDLLAALGPLADRVEARLRRAGLAGMGAVVKLKTRDFRLLTRHVRLADPTQRATVLMAAIDPLVRREADGRPFRLVGIGAEPLTDAVAADPPDLFSV